MNDLKNARDNHAELDRHIVDAIAGLMNSAPAAAAHPDDEALLGSHQSDGSGRSRILLVAAASAVVALGAGGLIFLQPQSDTGVSDSVPAFESTAPAADSNTPTGPVDTSPGDVPFESTPIGAPVTIPAEFPSDIPRPDTFDLMTFLTTDNEAVGWEFYERREPTDSVERCTQYASSFDASWTSIPKTDVHPSIYARAFDNGQWQVGIYCINDGGYLVQVMPSALTPSTVPPPST